MAAGSSRGGVLASVLHGFLHHGDPGLAALVGGLLTAALHNDVQVRREFWEGFFIS